MCAWGAATHQRSPASPRCGVEEFSLLVWLPCDLGAPGKHKKQKQGIKFSPILPFLLPVLPCPGLDFWGWGIAGCSSCPPCQGRGLSSTLGMWQEGPWGAAEFPKKLSGSLSVLHGQSGRNMGKGWGISQNYREYGKRIKNIPKILGMWRKDEEYGQRIKNIPKRQGIWKKDEKHDLRIWNMAKG